MGFKIICSNLISKDGKFLFVKETKKSAKGQWNFPAGKLEEHESIIDGAIREAKEETGLDVKPKKIVGVYQKTHSKSGNNLTILVFESEIVEGKLTTSEEHPEVKFFSYEEILEMDKKQILRNPYSINAIDRYKAGKTTDMSFLTIIKNSS